MPVIETENKEDQIMRTMAEIMADAPDISVNGKARDTVFTRLFSDPKNALEIYKALHPEDDSVSVDDISIVTIQNFLRRDQYNDLGMLVRDKLFVLVEAQSTWS